MALESNIDIASNYFTGEDKLLPFTIVDSSGGVQVITGWALSWMVKAAKTDADAAAKVTKTTVSGITITNGAGGICQVAVSDDDIAALAGGTLYHHELKRTDAGLETVLSFGTFRLRQAVHA